MDNKLRVLVDLRDRVLQKNRIAFGLRESAIQRGADQSGNGNSDLFERWQERFLTLEKEADSDIKELAGDIPIIQQMVKVRGVGYLLAAKVAAMIDIERANTVSALWRYAGYAVIEGHREKLAKGEKAHYNRRLKIACRLVGESFLKSNSPYRSIYDSAREYYAANREDWTPLHQHNAALGKMIKVWLQHLWVIWREMEGLEITELYVMERLGHTHYIRPEDFGW